MELNPSFVSEWMHSYPHLWQMNLLLPTELASLAKERGLHGGCSALHIKNLWMTGLLKAEFVLSDKELDVSGLALLGKDSVGRYRYADHRVMKLPNSIDNMFNELEPLHQDVILQFHPFHFRYLLALYNLLTPITPHPLQRLIDSNQYLRICKTTFEYHSQIVNNSNFSTTLRYHADVTRLCLATEPCTYTSLFSIFTKPAYIRDVAFAEQLSLYQQKLIEFYKELGLETIENAIKNLCDDANSLEPNTDIHSILRLTKRNWRIQHIKGKLGGAIYLKTMAEMLRRFAEMVFSVTLPEEDELSSRIYWPEAKKRNYGSSRIFDRNRRVANLYLRDFGLDYGVRLRWYVEGATELGALKWIFESDSYIELVNLRGLFIEGANKGLIFLGNLQNDIRSQIFSFCLFDSDKSENLKVVRQAIRNNEICGAVVFPPPSKREEERNFENENFTPAELKHILWQVAIENGATNAEQTVYDNSVGDVRSWKEILTRAKSKLPSLNQFSKGESWGRRLMEFAWENPYKQDIELDEQPKTRQIIEAVRAAMQSRQADYLYIRTHYRIDPDTGKPIQVIQDNP